MSSSSKISIKFISLGCPKNLVDSEVMAGLLGKDDFIILPSDEITDVAVVNTCGFIEDSKQESINTILELAETKDQGDLKLLIVSGCLSQRYAKQLPEALPEVDAFIGTGDFFKLPKIIHEKLSGNQLSNFIQTPQDQISWSTPRIQTTPSYTRYVKISEGCSHSCSFCTIPMMRGGLRSRTVEDVKKEIEIGVENGVKEFNLIAQDLNEYGRDLEPRESLFHLFEELEKIPGNFWLRPLYMYPLQFPDRLIRLMAEHDHLIPYVDIPLQHIDDDILKSMNRGSSSKYIYRLIENLRKNIPGIILRTTFIVGYPTETEEKFQKLVEFIKEIEFDHLGVFTYSHEEGTPAFDIEDQIDDEIKKERQARLMEIQYHISKKKNEKYLHQELEVLFEGPLPQEIEIDFDLPENLIGIGRFYGQAPSIDGLTFITSNQDIQPQIGDTIKVKINQTHAYDLVGEMI